MPASEVLERWVVKCMDLAAFRKRGPDAMWIFMFLKNAY